MALHVVAGAGPIGTNTALQLADAGEQVRVITRRGTGPDHPNIVTVAGTVADADVLTEAAQGAATIFNCVNPPYHTWPTDWPPMAKAFLAAAERTGAGLVITGNLYVYGPTDAPMTEDTPMRPSSVKGGVRQRMWEEALAAHQAGRVRVMECRASDFVGSRASSALSMLVVPQVLAGKTAYVPADLDAPHSFTDVADVARTMVALAREDRAWGHAWHVPTDGARSVREIAAMTARIAGAPDPKVKRMPMLAVRAYGLVNKQVGGFAEMAYQFQRPFRLDSSRVQETFGIKPTPFEDSLRAMIAAS